MPETLIKAYKIVFTDESGAEKVISVKNNRNRLAVHDICENAVLVRFVPLETYGCETFNVFGFELA